MAENSAHVELSSWGIGDAGVVDILKNETCNVLQVPRICNGETVHLHCVHLQENGLTDAGALVGYILRNRIRIDILKLYKNSGITSKGASKLAELYGFDCRPPPKELHLSDCAVCEKGAFALLLAISQRWRTAERRGGKAARPAYVRLDNNPFSIEAVQNKLYYFNFSIREGYDPRSRHHRLCEVHEIGGGPKLVLLAHMSLQGSPSQHRSYESYGHNESHGYGYGREGWWEEEEDDEETQETHETQETTTKREEPSKHKDAISVVEENLADPPNDVQGLPIQCGCTVQYHDDPNWIGKVVGFDYKGTAVIAWHKGAKKGLRTTSGGKYIRIVEQPATGAASSQEVVLPKEQAVTRRRKRNCKRMQSSLWKPRQNLPGTSWKLLGGFVRAHHRLPKLCLVTTCRRVWQAEAFSKTALPGELPTDRRQDRQDTGAAAENQENHASSSQFPSKPSLKWEELDLHPRSDKEFLCSNDAILAAGHAADDETARGTMPVISVISYLLCIGILKLQEPRDCRDVPLKKGDQVQYHDDASWLGEVVGFSSKDNLTVVEWTAGGKAGKRTFASGRFLRIVSSQVEGAGVIGQSGESHEVRDTKAEPREWHGLSGL
eukprot:symbB.v1.2.016914.t1/scaffold1304.1/size242089/8